MHREKLDRSHTEKPWFFWQAGLNKVRLIIA